MQQKLNNYKGKILKSPIQNENKVQQQLKHGALALDELAVVVGLRGLCDSKATGGLFQAKTIVCAQVHTIMNGNSM